MIFGMSDFFTKKRHNSYSVTKGLFLLHSTCYLLLPLDCQIPGLTPLVPTKSEKIE